MNQEAVFALRFVVKDLAKMRKATEQMNENLKKLQKNAGGASKNLDKVNNSFGKVTRAALKFAAAYFAVSKIIGTVFTKANEALQLNEMAVSAGVATKNIGKLGKALKLYGGDARSAGAAYTSLTNIIGGAQHGMGISEDVARVNAMYGIGFNYGNISQEQLMTQIAKSMHRLKGQGDSFAIQQIASAYGLSGDVAAFLATHGANWKNKVSAEDWKQMNMSDAEKLVQAQEDLKESLNQIMMKAVPLLERAIRLLEKVLDRVEEWANKKNPNKKVFEEDGSFIQTGKDESALTYNAQTKEYMVTDKDLQTVYKGKNLLKAEVEYGKQNYQPTWWNEKVVKPVRNWFGLDTSFMKAKEKEDVNMNVTLINKSNTDLAVGNVKQTSGSGIPVSIR